MWRHIKAFAFAIYIFISPPLVPPSTLLWVLMSLKGADGDCFVVIKGSLACAVSESIHLESDGVNGRVTELTDATTHIICSHGGWDNDFSPEKRIYFALVNVSNRKSTNWAEDGRIKTPNLLNNVPTGDGIERLKISAPACWRKSFSAAWSRTTCDAVAFP